MKYILNIRFSELVDRLLYGHYLFVTPDGKGYWAAFPGSRSDVAVAWSGDLVYDVTQNTIPLMVERTFDVPAHAVARDWDQDAVLRAVTGGPGKTCIDTQGGPG